METLTKTEVAQAFRIPCGLCLPIIRAIQNVHGDEWLHVAQGFMDEQLEGNCILRDLKTCMAKAQVDSATRGKTDTNYVGEWD